MAEQTTQPIQTTQQTQPVKQPIQTTQQTQPVEGKKFYKKWWFWLIVFLVFVGIGVGLYFLIF